MIDDMTIRNMTTGTQRVYIRAVKNFSLFFQQSPDKLTFDHVREYHLHLAARPDEDAIGRGASHSAIAIWAKTPNAVWGSFAWTSALLSFNQEEFTMTALTVTARGQVTFRKDVLQHLGVHPGEKIELDKLPDGRVALRAARPSGKIDHFLGLLAGKTRKVATLEEINEAAAAGWAGRE